MAWYWLNVEHLNLIEFSKLGPLVLKALDVICNDMYDIIYIYIYIYIWGCVHKPCRLFFDVIIFIDFIISYPSPEARSRSGHGRTGTFSNAYFVVRGLHVEMPLVVAVDCQICSKMIHLDDGLGYHPQMAERIWFGKLSNLFTIYYI